jgi:4-amino-4-deoxy-L-arabinose transferase-like glycosyltransferase
MQFKPQVNPENSTQELSFFCQRPCLLWVVVSSLFALAIVVRIYNIDAPGLIPERQYRSALIARAYYFEKTNSIPEWRKQVAFASKQRAGKLEPPVMELLVSSIYRISNGEHLWVARLLSSAFWLIGGIFLFRVVSRVVSLDAAVFATAYYLLIPLGILASRSFLPDSLMIMMFLISLYAIVRYYDHPSKLRLMTAASVSGLTLLIRPLVIFTIFGAFILLTIYKKKILKQRVDARFLIFLVIALLPAVSFYGYGIFIADFLHEKVKSIYLPHLFLAKEFWEGWLETGANAVGYIPLVAALIGIPMLDKGLPRILLTGLWIGYIVFCLVFSYHIHFADYYHLQLIILVALSFGPVIVLVINQLLKVSAGWYQWIPVSGVLVLMIFFNFREVQQRLANPKFESKKTAQEIGDLVDHSDKIVYLSPYYGMPLEYYGELSGVYWPRRIAHGLYRRPGERELDIKERFNALDFSPEYFIITHFKEFERHHDDLREYLANNCSLVAKSDKYLIYEFCKK